MELSFQVLPAERTPSWLTVAGQRCGAATVRQRLDGGSVVASGLCASCDSAKRDRGCPELGGVHDGAAGNLRVLISSFRRLLKEVQVHHSGRTIGTS
jgi:hypothetical protein